MSLTVAERFAAAGRDWDAAADVFLDLFHSGYVENFVARELQALALDPEHVSRSGVNQYTLTPLNTALFDYSIRIFTPFASRPHIVKWLGMRQMMAMKGNGCIRIRKFRSASAKGIEHFEAGVPLHAVEDVALTHLRWIAASEKNEILDIESVSEPCILEILTFKADAAAVIWTFDEQHKSVYAEQSLPVVSRFRNVTGLARAMGRSVPMDVCRKALESKDSHLALSALEYLIDEGHPEAFAALHEAIESGHEQLQQGAVRLLRLLTNPSVQTHAA